VRSYGRSSPPRPRRKHKFNPRPGRKAAAASSRSSAGAEAEGEGDLFVRTVLGSVPFGEAARWPVSVSLSEAAAYCAWLYPPAAGGGGGTAGRLPTEAEWLAAGAGARPNKLRSVHLTRKQWAPFPVGSAPVSDSAWGVSDTLGNGWEWTSSEFHGNPGFSPYMPAYPGYRLESLHAR
jgi:formylglycine-generating enzyme required for sulfatase activity